MKELVALNGYFFRYKWLFLLGIGFIILSNIFAIIPAYIVKQSFDIVESGILLYKTFSGDTTNEATYSLLVNSIFIYGIFILVMAIMRGIFLFAMRQTIIVMSRHIEYDMKNDIFHHYQSLPISFFHQNNTGDLMSRISEDVGKVRMYIGPAIMYGINLISLFVLVVPIMYVISPVLTVYSLLPLPVLSLCIYYVNNLIEKKSGRIQKKLSDLSTFVQESFSGIRILKSFARERSFYESFEKENDIYKKESMGLNFINSLFFPVIFFLIGLSTIFSVYVGALEVMKGNITIGVIAEFVIYVFMLTWPVTMLGWTSSIIQRASASQKRINEFLKIKTDIISLENKKESIRGKIEFRNVDFTYPNSENVVLRNINFTIEPGKSLAIVGSTGSGKSTIANLILRIFDVKEGSIYLDDTPLKAYNIPHFRSYIGYVPQDVFLFSDTIKNNIAFGSESVSDEDIIEASKNADLFENVQRFPQQFETFVGERGITLSGGQKQRLSLARAIIRNPKILILDDALSAIDTKTEHNILLALQKIMKNKTTIIISHRVSSAKMADSIIVIENGMIQEQGTHDMLIKKEGFYKQLYDKQVKES
ncbi:MAG: ABC transporter ATP-binding protein [Chitinophagaceae bacterium]|nr:ABC transporter ATP-binding protein [Chitinophagaceae bacterium]